MVISRKLIKPLHPPLEMNSQILQQGTNHKHLGLFFSNNGLWHDHIDYIVRERPFNLKGGEGGYGFFLKNILIPNVAEKNILILVEGIKKI